MRSTLLALERLSGHLIRMEIARRLEGYFASRADGDVAVVSAYLFGSHAEGRVHRESDVDVGVLLDRVRHPDAAERFLIRVRLGSELIDVLDRNDVAVVLLNDVPPLLGRHIVTHGRRVFCSYPEADVEFVRDVQLRAADLLPNYCRSWILELGNRGHRV